MSASLRAVCICLLVLALLSSLAARADHAIPQWQPQFSQQGLDADPRLEHAVALALPASDLATVIAELAKQSGVALACEDGLRSRPITIYFPGTRLKDVMAELAAFYFCEWWKDGNPPRYILRKTNSLRQAEEDAQAQALAPRTIPRRHSPEELEAMVRRIQEYAAALSLPQDELVRQYQDSDPGLVASLLDPLDRGFIPFLAGLSRAQLDQLTNRGRLGFRVSDLPSAMRDHVARWENLAYPNSMMDNNWAALAVERPLSQDTIKNWRQPTLRAGLPPELLRFPTWEERWRSAAIYVIWNRPAGGRSKLPPSGLVVRLLVPDMPGAGCQPIWTTDDPSSPWRTSALRRLFDLQHPNPTSEERAAFDAQLAPQEQATRERGAQRTKEWNRNRRLRELAGADWSDGEALARKLVVWPFPRDASQRVTQDELLLRIAATARLPLLADIDWPVRRTPSVSEKLTREQTLRDALEAVAGSRLTWSKPQGRSLRFPGTASLQDRARHWASVIPPQVLARWEEATRGQSSMTLEQYLELSTGLTPLQREFGLLRTKWWLPAQGYGTLWERVGGAALRRLLAGEEVPMQDLDEPARRHFLYRATRLRPWITEAYLAHATVTATRRTDPQRPGSGPVLWVYYNYHLPDAPADHEVAWVAALCCVDFSPLPDPVFKLVHPLSPFPEPASSPQAMLEQTNWMFRGTVTIDGKRSAMLSNDSTGEMELVEVGGTFRGLTVTEIRYSGVTFTDPSGGTAVLTFHARAPADPALWGDK